MEATKACPSCGTLAPESARRCKECFHDFTQQPRSYSRFVLPALAGLLFMAAVAAGVTTWITSYPTDQRVLVDDTTHTIQWVRTWQDGRIETDRLSFDQVGKLQYINGGPTGFQIVAITTTGEHKILESSPRKPLMGNAQRYAKVLGKPLEVIGEVGGPE